MSDSTRNPAAGLAAAALIAGTAVAAASPMSQTRSFTLDAPCRTVFPLFTADGERLWAAGWNPEILSGGVGRGSVFRTLHADGQETVWVVTEYRPELGRASYARIAQGSNMGLVDVRCEDTAHAGSRITVTYTLTALSPQGAEFVNHFLGERHFSDFIQEWKDALDALLKSGKLDGVPAQQTEQEN